MKQWKSIGKLNFIGSIRLTGDCFRKANKIADATSMITRLINEMSKSNRKDALTLKKLFVLIGLLYEDNRSKNNEASKNALNELLDADDMFNADYSQMTVDPWKGWLVIIPFFIMK